MALVLPYRGASPTLGRDVFLAATAQVIGDVHIDDEASIWYGTVIRGDVGKVRIAKRANVQDLCCVHMTTGISDAVIGEEASIGHGVIVHGAVVGAGALVGMGCVLMDNARIGEGALVGAGSLVTGGTVIPPGMLAVGRPARVVRKLDSNELGQGVRTAKKYVGLAMEHNEFQPPPTK